MENTTSSPAMNALLKAGVAVEVAEKLLRARVITRKMKWGESTEKECSEFLSIENEHSEELKRFKIL